MNCTLVLLRSVSVAMEPVGSMAIDGQSFLHALTMQILYGYGVTHKRWRLPCVTIGVSGSGGVSSWLPSSLFQHCHHQD